MTITLYTGSPGSGKSYDCVYKICQWLKKKKNNIVLANFNLEFDEKFKKKKNGAFIRYKDENLNSHFFYEFSKRYLKKGEESQCLIVIDEASIYFNARDWQSDTNRKDWLKFLAQHRKLGYDMIFICQDNRQIDRQIRALVEYEVIHRKLNNHRFFKYLPFTFFVAVTYWSVLNIRMSASMFYYQNKYGRIYDTFNTFE